MFIYGFNVTFRSPGVLMRCFKLLLDSKITGKCLCLVLIKWETAISSGEKKYPTTPINCD